MTFKIPSKHDATFFLCHFLRIHAISEGDQMNKGDSKIVATWIAQGMTGKGFYFELKCTHTHAQTLIDICKYLKDESHWGQNEKN